MNRGFRFVRFLALTTQFAGSAFAQSAESPARELQPTRRGGDEGLGRRSRQNIFVSSAAAATGRGIRASRVSPWSSAATASVGAAASIHPPISPAQSNTKAMARVPPEFFRLSSAFGLAEPAKMKSVRLPYAQLTASIECVDDVKSTNYNLIVDRAKTAAPDWNSSEKMRAVGEQYRLGVVVDHNADPRENGGGSCIFLHIWKSAKTGTSGCTAMTREKIESLLAWLDPSAHPALVQLPEAEYKQLQAAWALPQL